MNLLKVRKFLLAVILVLAVGGIGFKAGEKRAIRHFLPSAQGREVDLSLMWQVWDSLEQYYLYPEKLEAQEMTYGAVAGLTRALDDPYTSFLPPADNSRSKEDLLGEFGGVGIQLGYIEKTLAVMAPLPGHPAEKAGMRAGDLILNIKDEAKGIDKDTEGMGLAEAINLIRGEKGTEVILTVYHESDEATEEIKVIRDVISVPSIELEWVGSNKDIAWLKLMRFGDKTLPEWNQAVDEILAKNGKAVIIDFRNNPGGFLQRAIDLVSEFIPAGVVVQQKGKDETETFSVNKNGRLIDMPLVALVNKGSASASEIMAGALRERIGVKLVGENTFGKGTVQEALEFKGGAGLHVTIAEWLLPSGKNIEKDGLKVDVEVKDDRETDKDEQLEKAIEVIKEEI